MVIPGDTWVQQNSDLIYRVIRNANNELNMVNASLALNKFISWESINFNDDIRPDDRLKKKENLKNIKPVHLSNSQFKKLRRRKNSMPGLKRFELTTKTRLIVNHGNESVIDNSIAMHPYYGFPVIPGSAIKGTTRHFCKDSEIISAGKIAKIFGSESGDREDIKGGIIFFDAWPVTTSNSFEVDIFTPHYQNYYQGNEFPADNQSPIPIPFLTVRADTRFEFVLAPSSTCNGQSDTLVDEAIGLVVEALKTFGIGAKTGSSYGYFE